MTARGRTGRPDLKRIEQTLARASELAGLGRALEADSLCRPVLAAIPRLAAAHFVAGQIAEAKMQPDDAIECYRRATVLDPDYYPGWVNLGVCLRDHGDSRGAIAAYKQAIRIDPRSAQAYNNLASAQVTSGDFVKAISNFERALKLRPGSVEIRSSLANLYISVGKVPLAIDLLESALEINGSDAELWEIYGRCLQVEGRFDEADDKFRSALKLDAHRVGAHRALAKMERPPEIEAESLGQIAALLASDLPATVDVAGLHSAAAQLRERRGEHDAAFDHYLAANTLRAKTLPFLKDRTAAEFAALKKTFTAETLRAQGFRSSPSSVPVFIVGLPRSGTTLIEQIIVSHPDASGAGELKALANLLDMRSRLDAASGTFELPGAMEAAGIIDGYLAALTEGRESALRVTDKMPFNFVNLGMIHLLFPDARIIHCRRDPMDTCLSCFCQDFSEGIAFTLQLEHLGFYYRLYDDLMRHWRNVLSGPMLEVDYEQVIAQPEKTIREIIDFCGLPWDESCLSPHETRRQVNTASVWQVRQPIYQSSVARWKMFERHLGSLKSALGDCYVDGAGDTR